MYKCYSFLHATIYSQEINSESYCNHDGANKKMSIHDLPVCNLQNTTQEDRIVKQCDSDLSWSKGVILPNYGNLKT